MIISHKLTVAGIEFAYAKSPVNMQGIVMGLFWFSAGIGNFIGVSLPYVFKNFLDIWKDETFINCDRLDLFFYFLAMFLLVYSGLFIFIVKKTDLKLTSAIKVVAPKVKETLHDSPPSVRRRQHESPLLLDDSSFDSRHS